MDRMLFDILNYVNEGIIITDDKLNILFWNAQMESLTDIKQKKALNSNLCEVLPSLNKNYFKVAINSVMEKGYKYFFCSSIHKGLISDTRNLNVRVNKFEKHNTKYLIIECIDVTSQMLRVNQLKEYSNELYLLNKELKEKEKEIEKLAYYDQLTGLVNRTLFDDVAKKFLEKAKRNNSKIGLMFIDVDQFKEINDMYGHKVGDKTIVEIANLLVENTRKCDIVSRYGGDEFLILLPDIKHYSDYKIIASRIANANKKINISDDIEIKISLSIGVSFYPKDGDNIDDLILKADKAMYCVKNRGGNECIHYLAR